MRPPSEQIPLIAVIGIVCLAGTVRLLRDAAARGSRRLLRIATVSLLLLWLGVVVAVTSAGINPQDGPRFFNLVPFREEGAPKVIIANIAMFVPLGVYLPFVCRRRTLTVVVAALLVSSSVEVFQYASHAGRVADVTDILVNVFGALVGFALVSPLLRMNAGTPRVGNALIGSRKGAR